jgi:bifunctional non-homologous end joining protein LigD
MFVIQKHAATRLHYDFRLEMEGVLKSWAVPKGLPMKKGDRRLAVEVEDHPFDYRNFEGTIPPGNYGAGTVMVWDTGTYEAQDPEPVKALKRGKLHFILHGKKLKGEWAIIRMKPRPNEDKPQWLIFKAGENRKPLTEKEETRSAITGRTLEEIAEGDEVWHSNRAAATQSNSRGWIKEAIRRRDAAAAREAKEKKPTRKKSNQQETSSASIRKLPASKPGFVEPMKAMLSEHLPKGEQWIYEIKFDGVRALAIRNGSSVELVSRAGKDLSGKYGQVANEALELPSKRFVLDGEIVALDEQGRSSFQLLQNYGTCGASKSPLVYYVFDLLNLDGKDLRSLPLSERKSMAKTLLKDATPNIRFSSSIEANSEKLIREMKARGLEGLIAKRLDSNYETGRRSGAWIKYKWTNEQEFVVGGYTEPRGTRSHFGALLVGYYELGYLRFAAKVGTGFDQKLLESLSAKLKRSEIERCPFSNLPEKTPGLTAGQMRLCTWVKPELVCQVRFAEWTRDDHLRQPAFLGLREDKKPGEVVREVPR